MSLLFSVCLSVCVHVQVIAGAGMDVDFTIISPQGIQLIMESRRSDGVHVLVLRHVFHITVPAVLDLYVNL